MAKPNGYYCEGCPQWDDVNGCWDNCTEWCGFDANDEGLDDSETST